MRAISRAESTSTLLAVPFTFVHFRLVPFRAVHFNSVPPVSVSVVVVVVAVVVIVLRSCAGMTSWETSRQTWRRRWREIRYVLDVIVHGGEGSGGVHT